MPKFGGFSAGSIGGSFGKAVGKLGIGDKVDKLVGNLETKMETMSPEDMSGAIEKATLGNLASLVGGKVGVDVDASKIDGVIGRFYEAKSSIRSTIVSSILGVAEKAGYSISLPNEESINKFIEASGLMTKIENLGGDASANTIDELVKGIDIKKTATDLGLIVEKVPTKLDSLNDANKTLSEKVSNVGSVLGEMANPISGGLGNIAEEVTSAYKDIGNTVKGINEGE